MLLALLLACVQPSDTPAQPAVADLLVPEYQRTMSELFLLDSGRHDMDDILGGITAALPGYTQINFITNAGTRPEFLRDRTHRIVPDSLPRTLRDSPQFWAQDVFQVISRADGTRTLVLPKGEQFQPEAATVLGELGYDTRTSQLVWEGGNISGDVVGGQSVLYIGYTIYEGQSERAENPGVPLEDVQRTLAEEFEVDEVVPVPYVSASLFHLDQIFLITAPGEVVVHSLSLDGSEAMIRDYTREQDNYFYKVYVDSLGPEVPPAAHAEGYLDSLPRLQAYASQHALKMQTRLDEVAALFDQRGYTVHRLEADPRQFWDRLSLVNGVPYVDRETGEKVLLLPEYTNHKRASFADMHRAKELFESLDYTVRFVPVLTGSGGGGPHCLSNVGW